MEARDFWLEGGRLLVSWMFEKHGNNSFKNFKINDFQYIFE